MLADMGQCAFRLGKAFCAAAERAEGTDEWLKYFHAFDRCFFSVRVGLALELRLEREAGRGWSERREPQGDREDLRDREVLADRDDADDALRYTERDRDRETERASFPILIRALEGVCADAARLAGPEPAELPTLRELIARVKTQPPPVAAAPKPVPGLRTRLAGSGVTPPTPERRPASNVGEILAARRATGPPPRR